MASFAQQTLAERLEAFENDANEVDFVKNKLQMEKVGHNNSGEVILAQLFHYIERTMAKVMDVFEQVHTLLQRCWRHRCC